MDCAADTGTVSPRPGEQRRKPLVGGRVEAVAIGYQGPVVADSRHLVVRQAHPARGTTPQHARRVFHGDRLLDEQPRRQVQIVPRPAIADLELRGIKAAALDDLYATVEIRQLTPCGKQQQHQQAEVKAEQATVAAQPGVGRQRRHQVE